MRNAPIIIVSTVRQLSTFAAVVSSRPCPSSSPFSLSSPSMLLFRPRPAADDDYDDDERSIAGSTCEKVLVTTNAYRRQNTTTTTTRAYSTNTTPRRRRRRRRRNTHPCCGMLLLLLFRCRGQSGRRCRRGGREVCDTAHRHHNTLFKTFPFIIVWSFGPFFYKSFFCVFLHPNKIL